MTKHAVELTGEELTLEAIHQIACEYRLVDYRQDIRIKLKDQRARLDDQLRKKPEISIYGTNRLHGDLKDVAIDDSVVEEYQEKYVKVHNCGTGSPLPISFVRAMMVIRLNSFARGQSAIHLETCECMLSMLNRRVTPVVLEEGSVGASGDLVPLAMMAATMIGLDESEAFYEEAVPGEESEFLPPERMSGRQAMNNAGVDLIKLKAKEAMGLTNGSNFIAGIAVLECLQAERLLKVASITTAMTAEAIRGELKAFGTIINEDSNRSEHQNAIAVEVRNLLVGTERSSKNGQESLFSWSKTMEAEQKRKLREGLIDDTHQIAFDTILVTVNAETERADEPGVVRSVVEQIQKLLVQTDKGKPDSATRLPPIALADPELFAKVLIEIAVANKPSERVQDRYSIRAVPQVNGAARKAIQHLREAIQEEINSATDNPLFDFDNTLQGEDLKFASGANFHGQPLALVIDYAKIALTSVGLMSDKRSFSLLSKNLSYGLPADLAYDSSAADAGLMLTQYAGAARAADNRVLATPASVMSLSTAANQEDFVSMGSIGVINLRKVNQNLAKILAIELLCALRAIQLTYDWLPDGRKALGKGTARIYELLCGERFFPLGDDHDPVKYLRDHYLQTDLEKANNIVQSDLLIDTIEDLWPASETSGAVSKN